VSRLVGACLLISVQFVQTAVAGTYTVTSTNPVGAGSLYLAITNANNNSGTDLIDFSIGYSDANHLYYQDDGIPGQVTLANISTTSASSDASIPDIDPDFPKSWWRIQPTVPLPSISEGVSIDATTQTGFTDSPIIVLDGTNAGAAATGFRTTVGSSTIRGFVINNFTDNGIELLTGGGDSIVGNYVGTDVSGTIAQANTGDGIDIKTANNVVGGTTESDRNVVSGGSDDGIQMVDPGAIGNVVQGNYVGVNASGTATLPNAETGVQMSSGATNNLVGGTSAGAGNVISGNGDNGVGILDAGTSGNVVKGNLIGTDKDGDAVLGNSPNGILIENADSDTIGGTTAAERNVISGNDQAGIAMTGATATANVIVGNYIGIDVTGMLDRGNTTRGIDIDGSPNTLIGGVDAGNIISGNGTDAIFITGATAIQTKILGNLIGTDITGLAGIANNGGAAIRIHTGVTSTTIGGTGAGEGNTIAFNSGDGVGLQSTASTGNQIVGNAIFSNGTDAGHLGIDIDEDGVTDNDKDDGDGGPNGRLNFPIITKIEQDGSDLDIEFDVDLPIATTDWYRIEFFENPDGADEAGYGEGQVFLDATTIQVAGDVGYESFSKTLTGVTPTELVGISATATEDLSAGAGTSLGSTSEFGPAFDGLGVVEVDTTNDIADAPDYGTASFDITSLLGNRGADGRISLREAIGACNNTTGLDTIKFSIDTGTQTIEPDSALPTIIDSIVVDGTSQPGYVDSPIIEIDGQSAGADVNGLVFGTGSENSTARGLAVNQFLGYGFHVDGVDSITISGNYIGVDVSGTSAAGNGNDGICLESATNCVIGGITTDDRNVISGNDNAANLADGIWITGGANHTIQGNYIGTDATGTASIENYNGGIVVSSSEHNLIGGTEDGSGNLLSGNGIYGIRIHGLSDSNTIQGNYIGVNIIGDEALGNGDHGIQIESDYTLVGGTSTNARNVISGNSLYGISLIGANGTFIRANYIGTDVSGTSAVANGSDGISIVSGSDGNTIGGTSESARNIISGNSEGGIYLANSGSDNNIVQGNFIGVNSSGDPLGNGWQGILIASGAAANLVGGSELGAGNVVAYNGSAGYDGIEISSSSSGNSVSGNAIYSNAQIGIDIGNDGVTENDLDDGDSGPNDLQNFPVLTSAQVGVSSTGVGGSLNSIADNEFRLEFFSNSSADASGNGEGETYLGDTTVTTDVGGDVSFSVTLPSAVTAGHFITATATDTAGSTSEFSDTIRVEGTPVVDLNGSDDSGTGFTTTFTEDDGAVSASDTDATISDPDNAEYKNLGLNLTSFSDGTNEKITIAGYTFSYGVNETTVRTVGGTDFELDFDGTGFAVMIDGSGNMPQDDLQDLLRGIAYENSSQDPTTGVRLLEFIPQDSAGLVGEDAVCTVTVVSVNDDPSNSGSLPSDVSVTEDANSFMDLSAVDFADPDVRNELLTVTIRAYTGGTVTCSSDFDVIVFGSGTGWVTLQGGLGDLNNFFSSAFRFTYRHGVPHTYGDNADTIQVLISDNGHTGSGGGGTVWLGTVNIDISAVNDAPILSGIEGTAVSFTEGDAAAEITSSITVSDVDDTSIDSARIQITGNYQNGFDFLDFTNTSNITGNWDAASGLLSLTGSDLIAEYEAALQTVTFEITSADPSTVARTVSFTAYDGDDNSNTVTRNIDISGDGTLVVTTDTDVVDAPDTSSIDGLLADRGVDGYISLREAVSTCNSEAGQDTIEFAIGTGGQTIQPATEFPVVHDTVVIDGTSQPGYTDKPIIILDGSAIFSAVNGLTVESGGSTIKGLVINGFWSHGIEINVEGNNTIVNCFIGTDQTGLVEVANWGSGIVIRTDSNTVGGSDVADRNVIGGNWGAGVDIRDAGAFDNEVYGNYIGIDLAGTSGIGNDAKGVTITTGAASNIIGGTGGRRNIISGNTGSGVSLQSSGTSGNRIEGNNIGTNEAGTAAIPNTADGIMINSDASGNFIGSLVAGGGNVISGNGAHGIRIDGPSTTNNQVLGNLIGTNASGTSDVPNTSGGVTLTGTVRSTTIGGTAAGARNIISGNTGFGVEVENGSNLNSIKGNFIGTNSSGTTRLGNTGNGIEVYSDSNTIGGVTDDERNVISDNVNGILLDGVNCSENMILGNYIGTDSSGTQNLGNSLEGVLIQNGAAHNTIGGAAPDSGNTIAYNVRDGIDIKSDAGIGNAIFGNSIFSNTGLGIDLDVNGVNENDEDDPDTGPNDLQNFPVLSTTLVSDGNTTIYGSLNSIADNDFRLEFFSNSSADESGNGEGEIHLGDSIVTTDASGDVSFSVTFASAVTLGHFITATATDTTGNTSEFSDTVSAQAPTISVLARNTTFSFGVTLLDSWLSPQSSVIVNDGSVSEKFVAQVSQFTDGTDLWGISDVGNGADVIKAQWSTTSDTGPWTDISAYDTDFTVSTNVAASDSVTIWFRIETPTTTSSFSEYSSTLTVTAEEL